MSNYVKYTAADGTVHLCHEDSPVLTHSEQTDHIKRLTSMAERTFRTTWNNLNNFCEKNKIIMLQLSGLSYFALDLKVRDYIYTFKSPEGKIESRYERLAKIQLDAVPGDAYTGKKYVDRLNNSTNAINKAMREAKEALKNYHLMPGGYYISIDDYNKILEKSTKV